MMYPFLQIDGDTEIVHSEMLSMVKSRCISRSQTPKMAFITHTVSCLLPSYRWENIQGFTAEEIARYQEVIESTAHLIFEFSL